MTVETHTVRGLIILLRVGAVSREVQATFSIL